MTAIQRRSIQYSQNFLKSRSLVDELIDKCDIGPNDLIKRVGGTRAIDTIRGSEMRLRHQQARLEKIHRTRISRMEKRW